MYKAKNGCVLLLLAFAGCSVYSFRGSKVEGPEAKLVDLPCKFRVNTCTYNFAEQAMQSQDVWSIPGNSSKKVNAKALSAVLARVRPDLMTEDESGIPLNVTIDTRKMASDYSGLVVYFISLGTLPACVVNYREPCAVTISIEQSPKPLSREVDVGFSSKFWLTVWTPLAWIMSDDGSDFKGESRSGSGIMSAPHLDVKCETDQRTVFETTVAKAIICGLESMDINELRRQALLHALGGSK